jgi:glycosyltransferase involved in cell wall biosynthesis
VARSIFFYTDSQRLGGAERALFMLIETLDRAAWRPTLLLDAIPAGTPLAQHARELDVTVRTVRPLPLGLAGAAAVPSLTSMLRRERPDVFHAHLSWPLAAKYALLAAVVARVPAVVATVHLFPRFELDRSNFLQLRALTAGVGRYIAVSKDIADQLAQRLRWPAGKIDVVYNAVALDRFAPSDAPALREQLAGDRERQIVLTPARLDQQKGHAVLLRAAARLPDVVFVLAGEGPERAALEAQAAALALGERVVFLGQRSDVAQLLGASDAVALPSLFEGTSLAVLEAMAAGRPVVSSAIGGTNELIADGDTGLLVPPGDAAALARALRRVLADDELRAALARRARQRVERDFTPGAMSRRVTGIYEQLLARRRSARA